jgi:hypothetical protein
MKEYPRIFDATEAKDFLTRLEATKKVTPKAEWFRSFLRGFQGQKVGDVDKVYFDMLWRAV